MASLTKLCEVRSAVNLGRVPKERRLTQAKFAPTANRVRRACQKEFTFRMQM
jgi:hypothetical protein